MFVWEENEVKSGKAGVDCRLDSVTLTTLCKAQSYYSNRNLTSMSLHTVNIRYICDIILLYFTDIKAFLFFLAYYNVVG